MDFMQFLRRISFFEGLGEEGKSLFLSQSRRMCLKKGETLFQSGDPCRSCYFIEKGLVRIYGVTGSGKEPVFFLRRTGEMFGLAEILNDGVRMANAQTIMPTTVYACDSAAFRTMLKTHFEMSLRVINILGMRLRYLNEQIQSLTTATVRDRLLRLMVYLVCDSLPEDLASPGWQEVHASIPVSQEMIASIIGSTQPTISSTLQQLQQEGLLQVRRSHIDILDARQLVILAEALD